MRHFLFACLFALVAACTSASTEVTPHPLASTPGVSTSLDDLPGKPQLCGGVAGMMCSEGLKCIFADNVCGATLDSTGICTQLPTDCPAEDAPVCGCDGKTYPNRCEAHAAGTSVSPEWVCERLRE